MIVFAVVTVFVIVDTYVVVAALSGVLLWFVMLLPIVCLLILLVQGEALLPLTSAREEAECEGDGTVGGRYGL